MTTDYFWIDLELDISVAIPLVRTREVLSFPLSSLCVIPGVRPELLGVSNQRGNLLWVIDLPRLLMPTRGPSQAPQTLGNTKAVVLAGEGIQAAAIAVGFKGILSFEAAALTPTDRPYLSAQAVHSGAVVGILDVDQVFALFQRGGRLQGVGVGN
ncbi:MAG: CheW domain-containing protein [Synechocystis sp.]|nr:CheW domain-containing protein [Synechocystis sp.]